jgi:hypothetical protein
MIPSVICLRQSVAAGMAMLLLCLAASPDLAAHDLERTQVTLAFEPDGQFALDIANDPNWLLLRLESFAGGRVPQGMSPAARDARLRELSPVFIDRVVLFVDGHEIRPTAAEYLPPAVGATTAGLPPLATFRLRGRMPASAHSLRWLYGLVIDPYPLTIRRVDGRSITEWVEGSNWSGTLDLSGQFRVATRLEIVRDYLTLGYTHILPKGLDHILFVLGLFLLSIRWRPILIQVTAFTIAHSITLALTMYGVMSLSTRVVEPLIALSIAYVAIENLVTSELKPWRLGLVFAFGLLHGMGFAGVLSDLGLPRGEFLTALLSFNFGVEAGQLTVIGLAALCVVWYRRRVWYHRFVVVPASLAIAAVGVYWTVTRVMGS